MNMEAYAEYLQQLPKGYSAKTIVVKKVNAARKKLIPKTFKTKAKR